jgi:uncharacterized protein
LTSIRNINSQQSKHWDGMPIRLVDIVLMFVLAFLFIVAFAFIAGLTFGPSVFGSESWYTVTLLMLVQCIFMIISIWAIAIFRRGATWENLGIRKASTRWYKMAVPIGIATQAITMAITIVIVKLFNWHASQYVLTTSIKESHGWIQTISVLVTITIIGPIAEELEYRSLLYGWLRLHMLPRWSAIISAACFSITHGVSVRSFSIFLIGLVLAWTYERSGSIFPGMIIHGACNATAYALIRVSR